MGVSMSQAQPSFGLLHPLAEAVAQDMVAVDLLLDKACAHTIPLIPQVSGHLMKRGGKRLRPMLVLASAKLCGYEGEDHLKVASCLECIHNATLLHDDVMDKSLLRRGQPTAHRVWGTPASIVVGDFLLCRALEWLTQVESWPIVRLVNHMATKIIEGQTLDLSLEGRLDVDEATYFEVIHLKTAWLFQTACEVGALLTDHPHSLALRSFGYHAGLAFQMVDDVLDYTSTPEILGKNPGQDFQEGKVTLPIIRALAAGSPSDREFWSRTLGAKEQTVGDFPKAQEILKNTGAFESVLTDAHQQLDKACQALMPFPNSALRQALRDMVAFIGAQVPAHFHAAPPSSSPLSPSHLSCPPHSIASPGA